MRLTIITKLYGTQTINTDTFIPELSSSSSTIFKVVEHMFNEWFNNNPDKDIRGMYLGDGDQFPIYSIKGAIRDGISNLVETAIEMKYTILNTRQIMAMDIEASFL